MLGGVGPGPALEDGFLLVRVRSTVPVILFNGWFPSFGSRHDAGSDFQGSTEEILAVESLHGLFGLGWAGEFDETVGGVAAGVGVCGHVDVVAVFERGVRG